MIRGHQCMESYHKEEILIQYRILRCLVIERIVIDRDVLKIIHHKRNKVQLGSAHKMNNKNI